ncbi:MULTISPECIES: flagellar basal body-associated protein FliL [unclassified Ruegeria]|uniref:flagellar basal body-associated FliL family protein n=1 Tax=unclassified Ruegeria TaxID=2625375 RepID=UPI001487DA51|nr:MULTISPECIES: flagellar basal body-associated FliL family protein [unclassified Ruegeria]NOD63905.1 flagellar basal body protein FliL [Ruegeria sp. HKCCD6109]
MTDATAEQAEVPDKKGKKAMLIGVILAIAGAAGGYFLTSSGLIPFGGKAAKESSQDVEKDTPARALADVGFVDLPPVIVSVNSGSSRHLKFHAQLEVNAPYVADVEKMLPRIMDVLNGYLRAVELRDLEDPLALMRIRGHLLRRVEIVVGDGRVRDVLVMEFVLN